MAWDEFTACMGDAGEGLVDVGEDAVKGAADMWRALPPDIKAFIIAAARYGGQYVVAALEAAGVAAAEAIGAAAVGFGVGYFMAALVDCADKHL